MSLYNANTGPIGSSPISAVTPVDLGWAAGFTDGEGCIQIARQVYTDPRRRPTYGLRLHVAQSDHATLRHLQEVVGVHSRIHPVKLRPGMTKQPYMLVYDGPHAAAALRRLAPLLVTKASQAAVALEFVDVCRVSERRGPQGQLPAIWALRHRYYKKLQSMK